MELECFTADELALDNEQFARFQELQQDRTKWTPELVMYVALVIECASGDRTLLPHYAVADFIRGDEILTGISKE